MTSEPHGRAIGSLRAVALDAPDIDQLATFYEQLAGWRRVPDDDDDWITLDTGDGWRIGLQRATDHVPADWPDQSRPQQAHLDFRVPDIDAAAERARQLGASLLRRNERWHTLADPAGHPFDVCANPDDPRKRQPDITKARRVLGWEPKVALEDGLRETIEYFKALASR